MAPDQYPILADAKLRTRSVPSPSGRAGPDHWQEFGGRGVLCRSTEGLAEGQNRTNSHRDLDAERRSSPQLEAREWTTADRQEEACIRVGMHVPYIAVVKNLKGNTKIRGIALRNLAS